MTASLEVPELNDIAIEALAAQLFMMEFESDTQPRRWWHQSSSDIQAEYRKKATLQIIHWQRNATTKSAESRETI